MISCVALFTFTLALGLPCGASSTTTTTTVFNAATWDGVQCFDDDDELGTPTILAADRRPLSFGGDQSPIILMKLDWNTSRVQAEVAKIVLSEKAGFQVKFAEEEACCSWAALRATSIGCEPINAKETKCVQQSQQADAIHPYAHMAFDVYPSYIPENYEHSIELDSAPTRIGISYKAEEAFGIRPNLYKEVVNSVGLDLSYFRFYNPAFFNASRHYSTINDVVRVAGKQPLPCDYNGSIPIQANFQGSNIETYLKVTGDTNGTSVRASDGMLVAQCTDGWWFAPTCRSNPADCVPLVTINSWLAAAAMQLSTYWHLPMAIGSYNQSDLITVHKVVAQTDVLFYETMHDPQFSGLDTLAVKIIFPASDPKETSRGIYRTAPTSLEIVKLSWSGLKEASSRAFYFVEAMDLTQADIGELGNLNNKLGDSRKGACQWLHNNRDRWDKDGSSWVPSPGVICQAGEEFKRSRCSPCLMGFFSPTEGQNTRCYPCQPGSFANGTGKSICEQCSAGKFAKDPGSFQCNQCNPGRFSESIGMRSCPSCPTGRYNPVLGQEACGVCPVGANCEKQNNSGAISFIAAEKYYLLDTIDFKSFNFNLVNRTKDPDERKGFDKKGPYKCPVPSACLGNNSCHEGMEGPLCATCSKQTERSQNWLLCGPCPSGVQNYGLILIALVGVPVGLVIMDRVNTINNGNLRSVSSVVAKIFCNFFIQFGVLARNIRLQDLMNSLVTEDSAMKSLLQPVLGSIGIGKILENPAVAIVSIPCIVTDIKVDIDPTFANVLLAWIVMPFFLIFFGLALGPATFILTRLAIRARRRNGLLGTGTSMRGFFAVWWTSYAPGAVLILYFLHPMVTSLALSIFECSDYDEDTQLFYDTRRLLINAKIDCSGSEYQKWETLAYLSLLVWSIGVPCLLYFLLRHEKKTVGLHAPRAFRRYGFLYQGFEDDRCNYEVVYMLRRVLYLFTAAIPWLSVNCRTVLLLLLNCVFFTMHLSYKPYDDRAYLGLDDLDTWSYYTLVACLVGRLSQLMSEDMQPRFASGPNGIFNMRSYLSNAEPVAPAPVPLATKLAYLPVICCVIIFIGKGIYLILRAVIWPLEDVSCLPRCLNNRLDRRLHFTLLPLEDEDHEGNEEVPEYDHFVIATVNPRLQDPLLDRGIGVATTLQSKERELFKNICAEAIEVMLKQHELHLNKAPEIISIPTFMVQLERIFAGCFAVALVNRLKAYRLLEERDTWFKFIMGAGSDLLEQLHQMIDLTEDSVSSERSFRGALSSRSGGDDIRCDDPSSKQLMPYAEQIIKPVSAEELQVALMILSPRLIDCQPVLKRLASEHRGLLDMFANVTWIFEPESHKMHAAARSGTISAGGFDKSSSSREVPRGESVDPPQRFPENPTSADAQQESVAGPSMPSRSPGKEYECIASASAELEQSHASRHDAATITRASEVLQAVIGTSSERDIKDDVAATSWQPTSDSATSVIGCCTDTEMQPRKMRL